MTTNARGKRIVKIKPPRTNKPPVRLNKSGLEWRLISKTCEAVARSGDGEPQ